MAYLLNPSALKTLKDSCFKEILILKTLVCVIHKIAVYYLEGL
jgi:hypothetical protein